jgi:two-component system, NarL family, nitrate/nitrite response regulator NarL
MHTRIVVVDDHEVVRAGLKTLIAKLRPEWEICGEASDGSESVNVVVRTRPDIVLLDITMPQMSGLDACSQMRKIGITCPILIFTMHESPNLANEAKTVRAQGYVVKAQAARHLVNAIEALLAGHTFFGGRTDSQPAAENGPNPGILCVRGFLYA